MTLLPSARKRLYSALEHYDRNDRASVFISSLVVGVIAINLVAIILESIPAYAAAYGGTFFVIEVASSIFFLAEYLLRIWVCVEAPPDRGEAPGHPSQACGPMSVST